MKWSNLAVVFGALFTALPGISVLADAGLGATVPVGVHAGKNTELKGEVKAVRADIKAIRGACIRAGTRRACRRGLRN